jgi:DNA polymerase
MQALDKQPTYGFALRNDIESGAGKQLIDCDYSQVEARILQWHVGNAKLVEALRAGFSIYESYARLNGFWKGAGNLKESDPSLYALVKAIVLGLGFGSGADRFRSMAKTNYGITLSLNEAEEMVEEFRDANPKVRRYWNRLIDIFRDAIADGHTQMTLRLKSGRPLTYTRLHYEEDQIMAQCGWRPWGEHLWGGLLCENVISGMARDLLGHSILNLDKAGVPVILHTHDEVLCEVDAGTDKREIEEIILKLPDWARDFPLGVESHPMRMYEKR